MNAQVCDVCKLPISGADGDTGMLWLNTHKAGAIAMRKKQRQAERVGKTVSLAELIGGRSADEFMEDLIGEFWIVCHVDCCPSKEGYGYDISLEWVPTEAKALAWTFHIWKKSWFSGCNWEGAVRRLFEIGHP